MRQFAAKIVWTGPDTTASEIHSLLADYAENELGLTVRSVLLPDEGITEAEYDRDETFDNERTRFMGAGINKEPLPEGMPEL